MNEDLTTFIEPELEARIVALVLGEASAFEQEELARIIAERPEVRLYHSRLTILHGLVGEASNPVDAISWKLSGERREKVLARIREQQQPVAVSAPARKPTHHFRRRLIFYGSAACFIAILGGLTTPAILKREKSSREIATIVGYGDEADEIDLRETARFAGTETRERASAGDLLATIDGDYSMEVPTVKSESEFDVKLASNFTLDFQPEKWKEARKGVSFSSEREANTRDGGLRTNLYASIEDHVVSGNEGGKERLQRMAEAVEFPAPGKPAGTFFRSEVDRPLEPASEPVPANATVVRGLAEKAKAIDPTGFTGVAGNTESLAALSDLAAAPAEGQPPVDTSEFGFAGQAAAGAERELLGLARESVERKQAAPSSSLRKVIASSTVRPAAVPVPQPEMDAEFANGKDFGEGWYADQPTSGSNFFLGGGVVGRDFRRDNTGAANSVDRVKIPGIPDSPEQAVEGIVTAGNRSGSAAINRGTVDALLIDGGETLGEGIVMNDEESTRAFGRGGGGSAGGSDPFFSPPVDQNGEKDEEMRGRQLEVLDSANLMVAGKIREGSPQDQDLKADVTDARLKQTAQLVEVDETVQVDDFDDSIEVERKSKSLLSRFDGESLSDHQGGKRQNLGRGVQASTPKLSLDQQIDKEKKEDAPDALVEFGELETAVAAKEAPPIELQNKNQALPVGIDEELPGDSSDFVQRRFAVPDHFETFLSTSAGGSEGGDDPFGGGDLAKDGIRPRMGIVEILKNSGVAFPPGASVTLDPETNTLIARTSPENLELIDGIVKAASVETLREDERKKKQIELETFETSTSLKIDSTFSLNVSDVSFKLAKSSLAKGQWPEAEKVRPEEFVNALSYGDDTPTQAEKVACVIEQGSHPFM
ncbi:MAG: von Willebrand factor type A domain-containing protein, partial [Akkermansiaceae bacterium]